MKPYVKVYLEYFGYSGYEYMPCEVPNCGRRAVDVCHIWAKSIRPDLKNDIRNLMGKCREHHIEFGDKKDKRAQLQEWHDKFMEENGKNNGTGN